ncbi:MAG: hypothetical protein Q4A66_06005 [Eubacteriales bacterium]|nr:hypothetical protein [Eubacteriales bacterium]
MKRWIAFLLAAGMLCALAGCKSEPPAQPAASPTPQPPIEALVTPAATPTPAPTPEATAQSSTANIGSGELSVDEVLSPGIVTFATEAPEPEPEQPDSTPQPTEPPEEDPYTYASLTNKTLQVKFLYPEDWISDPSTDTITMVEPVAEGEVPARFSVTSFEYEYRERDISTGRLKTHLTDYLKTVVKGYNEYQLGDTGYEIAFADSTSIYATYVAVKGNAFIEGVAVVGYGKNGRVYCMHFSCEQEDYEGHLELITKLAANVKPIND